MTNGIKENEENLSDVDDIFDNNDSFSEESVTVDDSIIEEKSDSEVDNDTSSSNIPYSSTQQQQELKPALNSKFFAIRITGGQEQIVANILQDKITTKKINVLSILVLDNFKGYIIVEAPDSNVAFEALHGVRHVRGQIRGELPYKDIEGYLVKKPVVTELNIDDTVEVIAGPFKAMKAKITRVDYEKQEATVILLDSPYQIPVTVDANYLKKLIQ
ncbi:MAG TPA: transcription elongation factor Spt5 [Nitrososphaeraceae archaeon]|nr:transcription elongation factor Spt5 [Nitrososphaeraceae archaeon]